MHLDASCILLAAGLLITGTAATASGSGNALAGSKPSFPLTSRQDVNLTDTGNSTATGNSTNPDDQYVYSFDWSQAQEDAADADDANYDDPAISTQTNSTQTNATLAPLPPPLELWTVPASNTSKPVYPNDNSTDSEDAPSPLSTGTAGLKARGIHLRSYY